MLTGGLVPAVPVTFDRDHRFHERAHKSYVDYMRTQPIAGVAVWAHTGRGLYLSEEIARQVIEDWREALTDKIVIAGVGSRNKEQATRETLEMASRAIASGANAVLVYPPAWLKQTSSRDALIIEHHARLAELGVPLVLFYLYEAAGGISYNLDVLDELLSLPNIVGIKMATLDSVMTYQDVSCHIHKYHPATLLITGEDRFLGYSLMRGASAALIGMGAVCTELQAELVSSHVERDAQSFLELSAAVDRIAEVLFIEPMEGYIGRILFALGKLGIIPADATYDPWGPRLNPNELENIARVLSSLTVDCR
ncbi:MAG TPA: dihydrodipicolinate synthase family protein [Pyrinomonadaceae bacterium]|nr:dihydrodipicolinate synthase family protein [Pyrinomonadaceae bacterium]